MFDLTLSFDNGPTPDVTPFVLDVLARRDVKSTFFVIGEKLAQEHRALAERAHAEGHWIGNHTWSHSLPFGLMTPEAANAEFDRTQARDRLARAPAPLLPALRPGRQSRQAPAVAAGAGSSRASARHHRAVERAAARLAGRGRLGRARARPMRRDPLEPDGAARHCRAARCATSTASSGWSRTAAAASGRSFRRIACRWWMAR